MATTILLGGGTVSTANVTSYASNSFTPAAGDYIYVFILATDTTTDGTLTDSQSLGWTQVYSVTSHTDNKLLVFKSDNPAAATAMTVTWDCTADAATGTSIQIIRVAGTDTGIRQLATNTGLAANTPDVTFPLNCLTTSGVMFCTANKSNPHSNTVPTSFFARAGGGYSGPLTGLTVSSRNSGHTSNAITAGGLSPTDWTTIGVEIFGLGITDRALTDSSVTLSQGSLATVDNAASVTGQAITAAIGSVSSSITVALSGLALSVSVGTVAPSQDINVALTGQSVSIGQSSVTLSSSQPLSGQSVAASSGSFSTDSSKAISGQALSVNTSSINWLVDRALTGQNVSLAQGSVSANGDYVVTLTGQAISSSIGNIAPVINKAIAGQELAASIDSVSINSTLSVFGLAVDLGISSLNNTTGNELSGQSVSITDGTLSNSYEFVLSGHDLDVQRGSLAVNDTDDVKILSGVGISVSYQTQTIAIDLAQPTISVSYKTQSIEVSL